MKQSSQPRAGVRSLRRRLNGLTLVAALALGVLPAGCGSSKPSTTQPARTTTAAAAATQSTPSASTQQANRAGAARLRARAAAARGAAHARAVQLQATRAAAARAAQLRAQRAAAARKRAAQAAAQQKKTMTTRAAQTPPGPTGTNVSVNQTSLGAVLITASGRTLYLFAKDPPGQSACSAACAGVWPPLTTTGTPVAGQGAVQSKLGTTRRAGGALQVTYNAHPLYQFVGDSHSGQTSGEGLSQFGGLWWAVSAAGEKVMH